MKGTQPDRARFGVFELDLKAGELHTNGQTVLLQEQPLQVLRILVVRAGELVTREEIQKNLWPNDTVVEFDHGINTAIQKLRQALGDSADKPRYIQTVARRGYRFIAPVERVDSGSGDGLTVEAVSSAQDEATGQIKPESAALIGETVSHYRVLNVIGGGGMGVVYRAEDLKLGRVVALKFLPEELSTDPIALGRFEREARTASSLNHPNICTIHEIEEYQGQPFIVMEYLEGQTLRDVIASSLIVLPKDGIAKPTLSVEATLDIALQIAEGLEAAHEKGIIHRDIKPANILITKKGQVKILNFGLAKLITAMKTITSNSEGFEINEEAPRTKLPLRPQEDLGLTRGDAAIGTTGYMSPEQLQGAKLDHRTDLFCFGLVLYETATGRRAFIGATRDSYRDAILHQAPLSVRELNPAIPPKLQDIIKTCLEKDRDQRYQHASEIRSALRPLRREMSSALQSRKEVADRIAQAQKMSPQPANIESTNATPVPLSRWRRRLSFAVLLIAVAVSGFWYWWSHRAHLTAKDTIVVADFVNSTGDPVFDDILKMALTVDLQQSASLKLLSDVKVSGALQAMKLSPNERLTFDLAREICLRTNSTALLESTITDVGNRYRLALKAVNCRTAATLAIAEGEAENRSQIMRVLGYTSDRLRSQLGESKESLQKSKRPLDEATSSSPEALQAFTRARKAQKEGPPAALPYLRQAVELDPNFAAAYAALGVTYHNLGEVSLAMQNITRAYQLRNRLPDLQRLEIEAHYYADVTGELEKAIQAYDEWDKQFPGSWIPHSNLGELYLELGRFEKSAAEEVESIRIKPTSEAYNNLMIDYIGMNQLDDAKATLTDARARKVDGSDMRATAYMLAFLQNDNVEMQTQIVWAKDKPGVEDLLMSFQSDTEAYYGRFRKARDLSQTAVDLANRAGAPETAAEWKIDAALREAEVGNAARARHEADEALALSTGRDVTVAAALTLARAGDITKALNLADKLSQRFPKDTLIQSYAVPTIRAAAETQENSPVAAIERLKTASDYELGETRLAGLYPVYVRGQTYLKLRQGQKAAAEFQKIIEHPGIVQNFVTGALAYLQLGRAQAMTDNKVAARESYQHFLTLWNDADPDLRIYQQAKAEYAKLK
jgi:serine/threonine protein kinase/Flp pilus assembly protein TadD